jgi:hypothetical protein
MNAQASDLRMQANENLSIFPAQHRPKPENQILPAEPLADFQPSFQDTGGTPMLLFARPQGHARRRTQSIIGVSPVSPIPAKGADKARRQTLPEEPLADFKPSFRNTGGTPMILFVRP